MLFFLQVPSFANWQIRWIKDATVEWQKNAPQAEDPIGVSVYCGFAGFSKRTRVMISLQNRGQGPLCVKTSELIGLSTEEGKKLELHMPAVRGGRGLLRGLMRMEKKGQKYAMNVNKNFSCRKLMAKNSRLEDFDSAAKDSLCIEKNIPFGPGDVFEISYDFSVPFVKLGEFSLQLPGSCEDGSAVPPPLVFRCR